MHKESNSCQGNQSSQYGRRNHHYIILYCMISDDYLIWRSYNLHIWIYEGVTIFNKIIVIEKYINHLLQMSHTCFTYLQVIIGNLFFNLWTLLFLHEKTKNAFKWQNPEKGELLASIPIIISLKYIIIKYFRSKRYLEMSMLLIRLWWEVYNYETQRKWITRANDSFVILFSCNYKGCSSDIMDTNLVKCSSNTSISIIVNKHCVGLFYNNQRSSYFSEPVHQKMFNLLSFMFLGTQDSPWWKVDLGATFCLRKITVVNRNQAFYGRNGK